jgi:ribosomal protein S27AE
MTQDTGTELCVDCGSELIYHETRWYCPGCSPEELLDEVFDDA